MHVHYYFFPSIYILEEKIIITSEAEAHSFSYPHHASFKTAPLDKSDCPLQHLELAKWFLTGINRSRGE